MPVHSQYKTSMKKEVREIMFGPISRKGTEQALFSRSSWYTSRNKCGTTMDEGQMISLLILSGTQVA